jgi:hypothetical protein
VCTAPACSITKPASSRAHVGKDITARLKDGDRKGRRLFVRHGARHLIAKQSEQADAGCVSASRTGRALDTPKVGVQLLVNAIDNKLVSGWLGACALLRLQTGRATPNNSGCDIVLGEK